MKKQLLLGFVLISGVIGLQAIPMGSNMMEMPEPEIKNLSKLSLGKAITSKKPAHHVVINVNKVHTLQGHWFFPGQMVTFKVFPSQVARDYQYGESINLPKPFVKISSKRGGRYRSEFNLVTYKVGKVTAPERVTIKGSSWGHLIGKGKTTHTYEADVVVAPGKVFRSNRVKKK
jgi:hypothetical protein